MSYHNNTPTSTSTSTSARRATARPPTARRSQANIPPPPPQASQPPSPLEVENYLQPEEILNKKVAPPGYHYMPDGTLMLDSEMRVTPRGPEQVFTPIDFFSNETIEQVVVDLKTIDEFSIETSEMPTAETIREFTVTGTPNSKFIIQVVQSGTIKYYDFVLNSFTLGHVSSSNNLNVTLSLNGKLSGSIKFPSGGGTYVISLLPLQDTVIYGGLSVISQKIEKAASNAVLTFKAFTANTNNYATFPTKTSTGGPGDLDDFEFDFDITNASTDAGGFGLIPTSSFKDLNLINNLWFFSTTETVDGAVSPTDSNRGFVVKVDDLTDIGLGSYISAISSGTLVGKPIVTNIDTDAKELTISIAQTFANDITLTFRADGVTAIEKAIGVKMTFDFKRLDETKFHKTNKLVKTVRAGSSGTTINLNGTYGVGHNDVAAFISGVGITTATVVSVSASSSAGSMVVSASQGALTVGTSILFDNIVQVFNVFGNIQINSYSTANQDIYLDIDKFLTPGTAS